MKYDWIAMVVLQLSSCNIKTLVMYTISDSVSYFVTTPPVVNSSSYCQDGWIESVVRSLQNFTSRLLNLSKHIKESCWRTELTITCKNIYSASFAFVTPRRQIARLHINITSHQLNCQCRQYNCEDSWLNFP